MDWNIDFGLHLLSPFSTRCSLSTHWLIYWWMAWRRKPVCFYFDWIMQPGLWRSLTFFVITVPYAWTGVADEVEVTSAAVVSHLDFDYFHWFYDHWNCPSLFLTSFSQFTQQHLNLPFTMVFCVPNYNHLQHLTPKYKYLDSQIKCEMKYYTITRRKLSFNCFLIQMFTST